MNQLSIFDIEEIEKKINQKHRPWIDFIPPSAEKITNVLSYGGGKQTFAMLVLIEQDKLPKPDLIIFADTGREDKETYRHMREVALPLVQRLGVPYYSVRREVKGDTRDIYQYHWDNHITPIWPTCTTEFKLRPIKRKLGELFEIVPGLHQFDSWIGITTDEAHRSDSVSDVCYIRKIYPLLELGLSRQGCIDLIEAAGYPVPPKSGCDICPHKDWELMYTAQPEWFQSALALEENAATVRPKTRLPEHGRGLRMIVLQPKLEYNGSKLFDDVCSTGYCQV